MRTKKGDWVRVCYDGFGSRGDMVRPWLSKRKFRVTYVDDHFIIAGSTVGGYRVLKSWVRCADMKEGGK